MLSVKEITVAYDGVLALQGVSFGVRRGEIVSIVGSNGAGKSTILRAISGLQRPMSGSIEFGAMRIDGMPPHDIVTRARIAHVPEGRRLFQRMSVGQNLLLGAYVQRAEEAREKTLEAVYALFPVLRERRNQRAGTLSGGEQQMLAIARGLMLDPQLLMMDEPSLGVMPTMVAKIFATIRRIKEEGVTILLVEQNVREALELADSAFVLQTGRIIAEGTGAELLRSSLVRRAYLGM